MNGNVLQTWWVADVFFVGFRQKKNLMYNHKKKEANDGGLCSSESCHLIASINLSEGRRG